MNQTDLLRETERSRSAPVEEGAENGRRVDETERLKEALVEAQDRNLRLLADFDTFRRRAAAEKELAQHSGKRSVLLTLLPVLDTLERALATGSTDPHFYEGVAATFRLFTKALLEAGAEPFDSVGQRFDPWRAEFAALRVTPAHVWREGHLSPEVWLLCQRPVGSVKVAKYFFIHLPATTALKRLVWIAHQRWAIEQQYQQLKDELGLDHFEGRTYLAVRGESC